MSRIRQVLPGIEYNYPQQNNKINPLELDENQFYQKMEQDNNNKHLYKFFYTNYLGLGPLISKEICFQSNIDMDRPLSSLTIEERKKLFSTFNKIVIMVGENNYKPILIKNKYGINYLGFYALDIEQFGDNITYMGSINKVLDSLLYQE